LLDVLAPDVILVSDGGGVVPAARRPIVGAEQVARFLSRFAAVAPGARLDTVFLNGAPAIRVDLPDAAKVAVSLAVQGGRISRIYGVANPQKLTRVEIETLLTR
jgi:RNA polymerase sigma-70 factor (ECF subfamily)